MVNIFYLDKNPKKCAKYYCDKHVNKILIEILQILSQIHHNIGENKPPYKKCTGIRNNLAPYKWAMESTSNYRYCCDLAYFLIQEYKYRYNKNEHKCENALLWLRNNIPAKITNIRRTKFKLTDNVKIYSKYFNIVEASRYIYVDFKCKQDKWTKRNPPDWFMTYRNKSISEKNILIEKIMKNVKEKLPIFSKKNNLKPRRFHSFLRICYDNLFQNKWNNVIKLYKNMFDPNKPLIHQLGYGHLLKVFDLSNELFNIKKFTKYNNKSLKFRNKIK